MDEHPAACRNMRRKSDVPVSDVISDPQIFAVLQATRYFCTSFSGADPEAWLTTCLRPDSFFPEAEPWTDSADTMRRVLALVEAMRRARRSVFLYSNPRCRHCSAVMTQDERLLIEVVSHTSARQPSKAAISALMLCEGADYAGVISAADALAENLNRYQGAGQTSQPMV